jgi:hypothetical protein
MDPPRFKVETPPIRTASRRKYRSRDNREDEKKAAGIAAALRAAQTCCDCGQRLAEQSLAGLQLAFSPCFLQAFEFRTNFLAERFAESQVGFLGRKERTGQLLLVGYKLEDGRHG